MECRSIKLGHNLDPAEAERLMAEHAPKPGFLRLLLHGPLFVWFDGSYEGYGYDRLYWNHDAEAIVRAAAEGIEEWTDPSTKSNVGPLDPNVWVPTIAYKVMAKGSAPNFTHTARVDIWQDKLLAVRSRDGEPVLFSLAPMDAASTCDHADELDRCPNCGSGERKEIVMGYPRFDIIGDPNYELGGCLIDSHHPRGEFLCASCGHEWRSALRS